MALATATKTNATGEGEIRALIDERVKAVRTKDVDAGMSRIASDIMWFDVANPLQHVGSDSIRKRAEEWFSSFQGPIGYEMRDLRITAADEVAFSHSLDRFSGTKTDGVEIDMWVRRTVCYRKIEGKWKVTHEHGSVPFDMGSGKASLDLKP